MNAALVVAAMLALAVALALWRQRPRRLAAIALNLIVAALLYLTLFPPATHEDFTVGELVVLTPGATAAQQAALPSGADIIALPGVDAPRGIERVPDLATALRRHADVRRLRVIGGGLPARDRDAARGRVVRFDASPLPRGVVELDVPEAVAAGHAWSLAGRVEAVGAGRVELRDPSGAVVATQALDAQGRFTLAATAKDAGSARFSLDLVDDAGVRIERIPVALTVRAGMPLKVLLLAGAPDADLKYLRRWIADAGISLHGRILLSDGIALDEGSLVLDDAHLRDADLLILDERSWAVLDAGQRSAILAGVRAGLGLMLRVTGPLPPAVAADWGALGLPVQAGDAASSEAPLRVRLDRALALTDGGITLTAQAIQVQPGDAAPLLRADDGTVLAWLRGMGMGRIALWRLADSHRLQLGGAGAAFGSLWSDAFGAIARARGEAAPRLSGGARVGERTTACALAGDASIEDPHGARTPLLVDADGCAAYWPLAAGVHRLASGNAPWPFAVRDRDEAAALARARDQRETRALLGASAADGATAVRATPLPRWPFFLAFVATVGLLWWREQATAARA